jgi:hypothetical protein
MVPREAKIIDVDVDPSSITPAAERAQSMGVDLPLILWPTHTDVTEQKLFERDPELGDIHQNQMGDCWFLAALAAIRHMGGPLIIKLLMFDEGDHVVIKLHDQSLLPIFVRVHKSLVTVRGKAKFHSTGGLWPQMMEKAMSSFRKTGDEDSRIVFDPQQASYAILGGGKSSEAFKILLGVDATHEMINADEYHYDSTSPDFQRFRKIVQGNDGLDFNTIQQIFARVPNAPGAYVLYHNIWSRWIGGTPFYNAFMNEFGAKNGLGGVYRYNDFERALQKLANDVVQQQRWLTISSNEVQLADAVAAVLAWVRARQVFAEKRGTGLYNQAQLDLFARIERQVLTRSPTCLGTRKVVGTPEPVVGSSGEPVAKGLAGGHAYAVLDTIVDGNGRRYVQCFNPWGRCGRGYQFAQQDLHLQPSLQGVNHVLQGNTAYETESPIFWLELADVTKRCNRLYYCTEPPGLVRRSFAHGK